MAPLPAKPFGGCLNNNGGINLGGLIPVLDQAVLIGERSGEAACVSQVVVVCLAAVVAGGSVSQAVDQEAEVVEVLAPAADFNTCTGDENGWFY